MTSSCPHHSSEPHHPQSEKMTRYVVIITFLMMIVEIAAGTLFQSMALLADGWHMATHAGALGIAVFAYAYSRKHAKSPKFTFGTGKVNALGGLISSIILGIIACFVVVESAVRLKNPVSINFNEAIWVAVIGLAVNLASAWMLKGEEHHHDDAHASHVHHSHDHDHNLKAAYLHVVADALTSVTAILALLFGKYFGWVWMDPVMGIIGSLVILHWAYGLVKTTSQVLLDQVTDPKLAQEIRKRIKEEQTQISDLHLWQIAPGKYALIVSLIAQQPKSIQYYKTKLESFSQLAHITIEVS